MQTRWEVSRVHYQMISSCLRRQEFLELLQCLTVKTKDFRAPLQNLCQMGKWGKECQILYRTTFRSKVSHQDFWQLSLEAMEEQVMVVMEAMVEMAGMVTMMTLMMMSIGMNHQKLVTSLLWLTFSTTIKQCFKTKRKSQKGRSPRKHLTPHQNPFPSRWLQRARKCP